jgi:TonB family protein
MEEEVTWQNRTAGALVASVLLVGLAGACAGARNPPRATHEQNQAGLYFDPQGADFTSWIDTFKNEVYRNWIVPPEAQFGFRGHVDFEFTVERDGSMSALRMLKSSGTTSLDQAAQAALTASRFMVLPKDYSSARVTMQVTFFYNESPHR